MVNPVDTGVSPDWLMVNVRPEIRIVALRAGPGFEATENTIAPLPVPVGFTTEIQLACGIAVHVHPAPVVMATAPEEAADVNVPTFDESAKAQLVLPGVISSV